MICVKSTEAADNDPAREKFIALTHDHSGKEHFSKLDLHGFCSNCSANTPSTLGGCIKVPQKPTKAARNPQIQTK